MISTQDNLEGKEGIKEKILLLFLP